MAGVVPVTMRHVRAQSPWTSMSDRLSPPPPAAVPVAPAIPYVAAVGDRDGRPGDERRSASEQPLLWPVLPHERQVVAERPVADSGESIDRWPTLPDPVPDDDSAEIHRPEAERWARLEHEQRSA
jgi:hypothetical protein